MAPLQEQLEAVPEPQSRPAQKRRRSSMADLTGRLLMDDSVEGLAMLAPPGSTGGLAPPSSPQDSPAGRGGPAGQQCWPCLRHRMLLDIVQVSLTFTHFSSLRTSGCDKKPDNLPWHLAGRDMTTGLLLEDNSVPAAADEDSGQLGQLRKRLTLLQGPQARHASPCRALSGWSIVTMLQHGPLDCVSKCHCICTTCERSYLGLLNPGYFVYDRWTLLSLLTKPGKPCKRQIYQPVLPCWYLHTT